MLLDTPLPHLNSLLRMVESINRKMTYIPNVKVTDRDEGDVVADNRTFSKQISSYIFRLIEAIAAPIPENQFRYFENADPRSAIDETTIYQAIISPAEFISQSLFSVVNSVICTSATLTYNFSFDYFRSQSACLINIQAQCWQNPTIVPFDHQSQMLYYIPNDLVPQPLGPQNYSTPRGCQTKLSN